MQGAFRPRGKDVPAAKATSGEVYQDAPVPDDLIDVGFIAGAYGVHGWLKAQSHSSDAAAMLSASTWWLKPRTASGTPGAPAMVRVKQAREHSGTVVVQLENLTDRTLAERMKGSVVAVRRADFPAPEEGEFYWIDLIGANVTNLQEESLGVVEGLVDNGAQQILRVVLVAADGSKEERLIPFVDAYVRSVDAGEGRIGVDWGLDY